MAGECILVVEDNEKNMKLARDILRFHGFRVLQARTGRDAIEIALIQQPDLVLMDIQLPDMDGIEVFRRLRANAATAGLKIVALTAFAMKEDEDRILAEGFQGYVSKPIDVRRFADQVRDFCNVDGNME